jgi:uncharacterized membrane protein YsdA (DUF1294 family)/cold shock CspA family protein
MRHKGKIASWNDAKGFGFIAPIDGGPNVFVHINAFGNRSDRPDVNVVVTYSVTKDKQGRTQAVNATRPGEASPKKREVESTWSSINMALILFAILGTSVFVTDLPIIVPIAYFIMSVVTFVAYAVDKSAAQSNRWRTNESTLQLLALAGGWPGACVAQHILRHKSVKASFQRKFWVVVGLNFAGLGWLHTADGRALIEQLQSSLLQLV